VVNLVTVHLGRSEIRAVHLIGKDWERVPCFLSPLVR
jgi:hypothetical protein